MNGKISAVRWFEAAFVVIGSVVGAGFISGGELVRFFPTSGFLPYAYSAGIVFFAYFALLLACGKRYGGFDGVLRAVFKKFAPFVRVVFGVCCFVICATMLAGIDSVFWESFGIPKSIPVISAVVLVCVFLICRKGIGGIGKVNLILVPVILAFIAIFALRERGAEYGFSVADGAKGLAKALLYAGMNCFLAAPILCDLGKQAPALPVALGSAAIIIACAVLILGMICKEGANALGADMPLLYVVGKRGAALGKGFSIVCLFGIVTTLFSAYYPLHTAAEGMKRGELFRISVCVGALALARIGLKGIIDTVYPVLGAVGLAFGIACALCFFGERRGVRVPRKKDNRSVN